MAHGDDARVLACQRWFGYGRWDAPYWFIGMEPGGKDELPWYETWVRLGGHELCDCREHHLRTNYTRWHGRNLPATQETWRRLIQLLLGYKGQLVEDLGAVSVYQRDEWGTSNGETALLEVSAIRARSSATEVNRNAFRDQRVATLRERLERYRPRFVVFYGFSYTSIYEEIANLRFDADGYAWCGSTLCILLRHPAARNNPKEMRSGKWWIERGAEIRSRIAPDEECTPAKAPDLTNRTQDVPVLLAQSKQLPKSKESKMVGRNKANTSDIIRVLVEENPKRSGSKSRARFECYTDRITVADYESALSNRLGHSEARKHQQDIQWDLARNFIRIERGGKPIDLPVARSLQKP